jgi:site-specific DNA-methyltransferase (adenine-specific)
MEIVKIKLKDIIPYENNAKLHPKKQIEQIKTSIKEFGNNDPIAVDENNVIIEGHGRYTALKELGYEEAECIVLANLTEDQKNAYRLVHNKLTMNSDFDLEMLKLELDKIDFDMEQFDFSFEEEKKELEEDDFDFDSAVPDEPVTKLGDIWKLGNHYLMCGDSTDQETVAKLLNGAEGDLLITDPPYNVNYTANQTRDGIQNDNFASPEAFTEFLSNAFINADEHMKAGACLYIYFADKFASEVTQACKNAGWNPRHMLIWEKDSLVLGQSDYQYIHEPFIYSWKEGASHNWFNDRKQTSVLHFDRPKASKLHPTMKPLALFSYQIQNSSRKGDVVLDLFAGSGTTLICCEQLDRICYTMELDPVYCDVIIARWEELTGKKAVRIKTN